MQFESVRFAALGELWKGMYTPHGNPRPCVWQGTRYSLHSALYCNLVANLESLEDILREGTWCDHVEVIAEFSAEPERVRLIRYYGLAFLAFEQCVADLRLVRGAIAGTKSRKVEPTAERYMAFINRVWKHRAGNPTTAGPFHTIHHHGPYLLADCDGYEKALPADGHYFATDHQPPIQSAPPIPLVVPSLPDAMRSLSDVLLTTSGLFRQDPAAKKRVDAAFGLVRL